MNRFLLPFFCFFCPALAWGQWTVVPTGTDASLESVFAYDQNTWLLGGGGVVLRSANTGATWDRYPLAADGIPLLGSSISALHFTSPLEGVATGLFFLANEERVLKTTNGGQTWSTTHRYDLGNYPRYFNDLFFSANGVEAWTVGTNGRVLVSRNGGNTWSPINIDGVAWELASVAFPDTQRGFIGGAGGLLRTTDGGNTWSQTPIKDLISTIQFLNAQTGFIGGYGLLKATADGGNTWRDIPLPPTSGGIEELWFADDQYGYVLAFNGVYRTTNGGAAWEKYQEGVTPEVDYRGFFWTDRNHGMVVGDKGFCAKTANGRLGSWAPIAGFEPAPDFKSCAGLPQKLENKTADLPTYTYQWFLNGQLFSTERHPTVVFPNPATTYQVTLVAANGNARDSAFLETTTRTLPVLNAPNLIAGDTAICRGLALYLRTPTYLDGGVKWSLYANGGLLETDFFGDFQRTMLPLETTLYQLRGILADECGAVETTAQTTVTVTPMPLYSEFKAIPQRPLVCEGDSTLVLVENTVPGALYQWTGNLSGTAIGTGGTLAIHTGPIGGGAVYDFTVWNGNCYRSFQNAATVKSDIAYSVQNAQLYTTTVGQPITIDNYSQGARFRWDFGTNASPSFSTALSPKVSFQKPGLYPVRLDVHNTIGCSDTSYTFIEVFPDNVFPASSDAVCASELSQMQFVNPYLGEKIMDSYTDMEGNTYVTGYQYEPFSWWGSYNLFYNKYDAAGKLVWARYWPAESHGNSPFDYFYQCLGNAIAADPQGNIYIGGTFAGRNMKIGGVAVFEDANPSAANAFLVKLSPEGTLLWAVRYLGLGGQFTVAPTELVLEKDNRLVVLLSGKFNAVEAPGQTIQGWDTNALLHGMRFDPAGMLLQIVPIGLGDPVYNTDLYADYNPDPSAWITSRITRIGPRMQRQSNGDWVLSGFFRGKMMFDGILVAPRRPSVLNAFALRLDHDFKVKKAFATFSTDDTYQNGTGYTNALLNLPFVTDTAGNIYQSVSLGADEYTWFPPGSIPIPPVGIYLNDTVAAFGDRCHFLLKYNAEGQLLWSIRSANACFSHLAPLPDGSFYGMANYGHTLGLHTRSGQTIGIKGLGQLNLALVHWSTEGDVLGVRPLSTPLYDHGNWLSSTPNGSITAFYSQNSNFLLGDTAEVRLSVFDPSGICSDVPLQIVSQPQDAPFCPGASPFFSVNAVGGGITYQWQQGGLNGWVDLVEAPAYQGVRTALLRLVTVDTLSLANQQYRCVLKDAQGNVETTAPARPILLASPELLSHPESVAVAENASAVFSVVPKAANARFQWQADQGNGWFNLSDNAFFQGAQGATLMVLTHPALNLNGLLLRCCLTDPTNGCVTYSNAARLDLLLGNATQDVTALPGLKLFPNPAFQQVWLQWQNVPPGAVSIAIKNTLGHTLFAGEAQATSKGTMPIDISDWPSGTYEVLFFYGNNTLLTGRLVK